MKVFISWSGTTSREVAQAFHDWLPFVIQAVKPFISTGDIDKGKRWSDVLSAELNETGYGIMVITPDNFDKPWLHFEAGAISKSVDKAYDLKKKLDKAAETQDLETHTGFPWLYNADDVARRQEDTSTKAVWIVTADVYRNVLNDGLKKALQRNMDRALTYTFVMPASDAGSAAKEALKRISASKSGKVLFSEIPEDEFREAAVTDYIILNPDTDSMTVFLELPISAGGFWIKVKEDSANSLVVRFRKLAHASSTL